jgi:hypothetical protein
MAANRNQNTLTVRLSCCTLSGLSHVQRITSSYEGSRCRLQMSAQRIAWALLRQWVTGLTK